MKKSKWLFIVMLILGMLSVLGCTNEQNTASRDIWGQADALEVDLNSKIPGYVVDMKVEEGAFVKKGDVIAKVDSRQLQAQSNQVQAQKNAALAQLAQAAASMSMAEADKNRFTELFKQGAVSQQVYEGYQTKYHVAVETYKQAQAAVDGYAQAITQVEVNIEDTEIKAPFDGIITTKYVNAGAMVSSGMPIYTVQQPSNNWVNFKIPETMLSQFTLGQTIKLIARDGKLTLEGKIVDISKKPDFATQRATSERGNAGDIISFNVKVRIDDERIRPGMRLKMVEYTFPIGE